MSTSHNIKYKNLFVGDYSTFRILNYFSMKIGIVIVQSIIIFATCSRLCENRCVQYSPLQKSDLYHINQQISFYYF